MDLRFSQFIHEANNTETQIEALLNGQNLIMFFKKDGKIYGAGEDGRLTFARMKDKKDDDVSQEWRKEANFSAIDLGRALEGVKTFNVFAYKDLKDIQVIDRDKAKIALEKLAKKVRTVKAGEIPPEEDDDEDPGIQLTGDEE